jgi:hypothetical protein
VILDYKEFTRDFQKLSDELPELLAGHHKTRDLAPGVQRLLQLAESRFTLAIVGQMRAGKSSLLNALIGADLAMVGVNETTATINWFTHGTGEQTQKFRVHWKGRPPEDKRLAEKEKWVGESEFAKETRKLEFFADTDFLRIADVVDTPGTRSLVASHQETIDQYLAQKADSETRELGSGADAILYVVPPVAHESDQELLEKFKQTTRLPGSPPHNSLAVVHKWETLESDDPHAEAGRKAVRIYEAMRDVICGAMPVSAPLGWAGEHFEDAFWNQILTLSLKAALKDNDFQSLLKRDTNFTREISGCPLDARARIALRREFPLPWPCLKIILQTARQHRPATPSELRVLVLETSGLPRLRQEVQNRFFARARALKLSKLLAGIWEPCELAQQRLRHFKFDLDRDLNAADHAKAALAERIRIGDSGLVPVQEFVQSASSTLRGELNASGKRLGRFGEAVLKARQDHEAMERDFDMLDLLDQPQQGLAPKTLDMLRALFGGNGADVAGRLSFFNRLGKTTVTPQDLDEANSGLRSFIHHCASESLKKVLARGIDLLEEIANWMEERGEAEIRICSQNSQP